MALWDLAVGGLSKRILGGFQNAQGSEQADLRFPIEDQDDYVGRITFVAKREKYKSLAGAGLDVVVNTTAAAEEAVKSVTGGTGGGGSPATSVKVTPNDSERSIAEQAAAESTVGLDAFGPVSSTSIQSRAAAEAQVGLDAFGNEGALVIDGVGINQVAGANSTGRKSTYNAAQNSATVVSSSPRPKARQSGGARRTASASTELSSFQGNAPDTKTITKAVPEYELQGSVQLYLPSTLQFADNIEYANVDLGIKGTAVSEALRSGKNIIDAGLAAAAKIIDVGGFMEAMEKGLTSSTAQVLALRLASFSTEVQGAVETETGIALNPNRRSTLRGVGVRRFRFTFKLQPTSPQEAKEITKIINFFREQMYPEMSGAAGLVMNFPSKFDIKMHWGGKRVATQILPCFLENVDVVYNPNSMAFHDDGEFQQTDITLSFIEERALTKADIRKGY